MKHTWTVPDLTKRERLDVFVTEQLPEMTRSHVAKLLKHGAGKVNDKTASVHEFLKTGDVVEFDDETSTKKPEDKTKPKHIADVPDLKIIDESPDWVVIDKPAGLIVHPDRHNPTNTLIDAILKYDPKIASVGGDPERPGIMHRLDREASGLMVIARSQEAFDGLQKQFAEHSVEKRYLALVYGTVMEDEGEIKFRIAHSKTKNRMAARPTNETVGKAAWTHFKTLKRFHNAALLELDIFSGRTHQIRAHLLAYNHPIIGDPLYVRRSEDRNIKAPRLMLQSVHLHFRDPKTGDSKSYDLPPTKEFDDVIKTLS